MPKTFKCIFTGRLLGAIGKFSTFVEYVKADNKEAALRQLYNKYDHIQQPQINAWKQDPVNYGAGRPSGM